MIPLFLELGRLFEERSALGARAAIDGIRALGARQAMRWRNGVETRVDPNTLVPDFGTARHPTQVYEGLYDIAVLALLWWLRKRVNDDGVLFWVYAY